MVIVCEIYPYKGEKVHRKKLHDLNKDLLFLIQNTYEHVINNENTNIHMRVNIVLDTLVKMTSSSFGFVALNDNNICPKIFSHSTNENIPITNATLLNKHSYLLTSDIVISNNVKTDPRFTIPENHEILNFLTIPLYNNSLEIIGHICLCNSLIPYSSKSLVNIIPATHLITSITTIKTQVINIKDSFIATMSHEIRTPLNGIIGMTRLLQDSGMNLTSKQHEYINILTECSSQLMDLVNDILDYSRMKSGNFNLTNVSFNFKSLLKSVNDIVAPRAHDKNIQLKFEIDKSVPENLIGDSRRLKQVILNILINAIKFTNVGSVTMTVSASDMINEETQLKLKKLSFNITDTGIGIKKQDFDRIFEVFTKINKDDHYYTNTVPGAGIGLSICKYIINKMNGEIHVDSDGQSTSTFTFFVLLEDETEINTLVNTHDMENVNILVINADEDARIMFRDILIGWKIKVTSVHGIKEALSCLEKSCFDITILETSETAQLIKERGYKTVTIGYNSEKNNWIDYFLPITFNKSFLFNLILKITCEKTVNSPTHSHFKKLNIIVAEDDYYNQVLINELLSSLGYTNVKLVSNGKLCYEEIKRNPKLYHVCLMDVKMPIMDGLYATQLLKKLKHCPKIIGVTASVLDSDKHKCYQAGMDSYLSKPIQKEQLAALLKNIKIQDIILDETAIL